MKIWALLSTLGLALSLGQGLVHADTAALLVSAPAATPPGAGSQMTMAWTPSPDTNVSGYNLCWGLATGQCTNVINIGNVTNTGVGGLSTNITYYFTIVAYDQSAHLAPPSNEVHYTVTNQTVLSPPVILADITNVAAAIGANAIFQVGASGSAPLSYQWLFNGTNVPGATNDFLSFNVVSSTQQGTYQALVSNSAGSATSSVASLTVLLPPSITQDLKGRPVAAGQDTVLEVGVAGTAPFGFQWLFNGTSLPGASSNPLTLTNVTAAQAGVYQVVVTNSTGSVTSSVASLSVLAPPRITQDLTNQSVAFGTNVFLAVAVEGSDPLGYQWLFNGTNLASATSNPLILSNITVAEAGSYQVLVTNAAGAATSSVVALTVHSALAVVVDLTNQTVLAGSTVTFQIEAAGTSPSSLFQWRFNGNDLVGATQSSLSIPNVSLSQAGQYQVTACDALGCVSSSVVFLDVRKPAPVSIQQAGTSSVRITFVGIPGQTYVVLGATDVGSTWEIMATVVADALGTVQYDAEETAGVGFFRIASP